MSNKETSVASGAEGAFPLPIQTPPMEAKSATALPQEGDWQFEPKWDGFRCLIFKHGRTVDLRAKSGKPLGRYFPDVVASFQDLGPDNFVLDGELVIELDGRLAFGLEARAGRWRRAGGAVQLRQRQQISAAGPGEEAGPGGNGCRQSLGAETSKPRKPKFPGLHAQRRALEAGEAESGCTVHFVDEGTDSGPIVLQERVPIEPGDTEEALAVRILEKEHRAYPEAIARVLSELPSRA